MQKTLYIPIDTTLDNTVECEKLVKRGDMLILTIKVFTNGVLADLTGQTIDLILRKSDNTIIEKTITSVANGIITAVLTEQATLAQGTVSGEIQIYSSTLSHLGTNTFTFKVDASIADDVLAKSEGEIETLADLKAVIDTNNAVITEYVSDITAIAGTAESVQALANTKLYIDTNITALQQANGEAVVNIANEKVQNDKAEINIPALTTTNTNASTLKIGLEADIASGTTLKNTLETDITAGTTLQNGLESDISTGNTLKINLEADIVTGNTLKNNIDEENVRAEANITAMQGFGDVTQLTQNVTALKTEVETARNGESSLDARLDKNDVLVASNTASLSERVKKSTVAITYFVSPTGSDTNDGLTSGTAFKTIQHAIDSLPQMVNHDVTINVASGNYNELITISGFLGCGKISLKGGVDLATAINYQVNSIYIINCSCPVIITGFQSMSTTGVNGGIYCHTCLSVDIKYYIDTVNSLTKYGIRGYYSSISVQTSTISNKNVAILADWLTTIFSIGNGGTNNNTVLSSCASSTIGKQISQPTGTTAETVFGGGVIR